MCRCSLIFGRILARTACAKASSFNNLHSATFAYRHNLGSKPWPKCSSIPQVFFHFRGLFYRCFKLQLSWKVPKIVFKQKLLTRTLNSIVQFSTNNLGNVPRLNLQIKEYGIFRKGLLVWFGWHFMFFEHLKKRIDTCIVPKYVSGLKS